MSRFKSGDIVYNLVERANCPKGQKCEVVNPDYKRLNLSLIPVVRVRYKTEILLAYWNVNFLENEVISEEIWNSSLAKAIREEE